MSVRFASPPITGPAAGPIGASTGARKKVMNIVDPTQNMPPTMWITRSTIISAVMSFS